MLKRADIGREFAASIGTYNAKAGFHFQIAHTLAKRVAELGKSFTTVLEIGYHTGMQTEAMLSVMQSDSRLILLDIHKTGKGATESLVLPETYLLMKADGEDLPIQDNSFDLIYS